MRTQGMPRLLVLGLIFLLVIDPFGVCARRPPGRGGRGCARSGRQRFRRDRCGVGDLRAPR